MYNICDLTAVEIGRLLKDRELSEQEVLLAFYKKTKEQENRLNAFLTISEEFAFQKAEEIAKRRASGEHLPLLAGVPIAVKDNISTKGIRTTCASKMLEDYIPPFHAEVVERLLSAGMIIFGKTNMDEFAMGSTSETSFFGAVSNPVDDTRVPGGSSGGSAAAVASGEVCIALGSDTGGSVRQPASFCGVTGFLPTYGSVSRYGLIAYASSFDQIGPIAKTAEDCAAVFDIICGKDNRDSTSVSHPDSSFYESLLANRSTNMLRGKVIGLPVECFSEGVSETVKNTVLKAAEHYAKNGAQLISVSLPFLPLVISSYYMISTAEASSNLSRFDGIRFGTRSDGKVFSKVGSNQSCSGGDKSGNGDDRTVDGMFRNTRSEGFGEEVKRRLMLGTFVLSDGYYDAFYRRAQEMQNRIISGMQETFQKCDVLLLPTAPDTAQKKGSTLNDALKMYLSDTFTAVANLAGLPGISIPCGTDESNLPIGMQLIGPKWSDKLLLCMADSYQQTEKESGV